jgi:hypothetical protein
MPYKKSPTLRRVEKERDDLKVQHKALHEDFDAAVRTRKEILLERDTLKAEVDHLLDLKEDLKGRIAELESKPFSGDYDSVLHANIDPWPYPEGRTLSVRVGEEKVGSVVAKPGVKYTAFILWRRTIES